MMTSIMSPRYFCGRKAEWARCAPHRGGSHFQDGPPERTEARETEARGQPFAPATV